MAEVFQFSGFTEWIVLKSLIFCVVILRLKSYSNITCNHIVYAII